MNTFQQQRVRWLIALAFGLGAVGHADVLPEDRSDVLYHRYDGGGLTVQGPSVLVRKKFGDSFSASYQYYEDLISSASIDVVSQASAYKERRTQNNVGLDYLRGNTLYSIGWINSNEPDYKSNTGFFNISQSMFGDLTTVSFGFAEGWDKVGEVSKGVFQKFVGDADHRNWSVGLSQVLTRNMLLGLNFEADENNGYLQNPYRGVRFVDPFSGKGYSFGAAVSPNTRTGIAGSAQLKYYLPWHAAVDGNYRLYNDTWGITANTAKLGYTQTLFTDWTLEASARYYWQTAANFYSDLFPYQNSQNFMSRDRELAQFHSLTLGLGASYEFHPAWPRWIDKGTLNFNYNRMRIDYLDFHNNLILSAVPGDEPLYTLDASVMQFFISFWY
ncbi:MAG TPA: DUF3570 domain-containing protein [Steroidobacteraceae bacterium]